MSSKLNDMKQKLAGGLRAISGLGAISGLKAIGTPRLASSSTIAKSLAAALAVLLIVFSGLGFYWSNEPSLFDVNANTGEVVVRLETSAVTGSATLATMITLADKHLHKPGGYLTNDVTPPSILLDNMPNWEFGVLVQIRDMSRTLRNNLSRSQSQSSENADLVDAENQFYHNNDSWIFPQTEREYRKGIRALEAYLKRLGDPSDQSAQFYARADNLRIWLSEVETRLGSLSQRLSASVGKRQIDTSFAGERSAGQPAGSSGAVSSGESQVMAPWLETPWLELDDVFYEARGTTWALIHLLRAVEVDFRDVLQDKNALVSLQQIIRELEPTQDTLWSPIILNGSGFGMLANHSLVMGSHISRANAAIIDLRRLLEDG